MMLSKLATTLKEDFPKIYTFFTETVPVKLYYYQIIHKIKVIEIRKKGSANVIFFASSLGMWRYQDLYEKLNQDKRFNCMIILRAFVNYSEGEKQKNIDALVRYFDERGINYINGHDNIDEANRWITDNDPDIMFYPQPYDTLFGNALDSYHYHDKLLCYYPYGLYTLKNRNFLNYQYQNFCWKLFLQSKYHIEDARKYMINKGKNAVLVGEPNSDAYFSNNHIDRWKPQKRKKKRVIWAPHFTVFPDILLHRDSFLWMHQVILDFAEEYKDEVQVAFKPHPRLKTELYLHPDWGKEKTDEYFRKWEIMDNLQFEDGEFIDLFCTSDLMIHDSGSFIADYMYTGKPVIFTSRSKKDAYDGLNEFGRKCMDLHYHAHDADQAKNILASLLFGDADSLKSERIKFRDSELNIHPGKSVADVTYENITKSLGWKL